MALPWVRLDTQWPHNPKFLMLVEDRKYLAVVVYMGGLGWSGAQGQDGFVPYYALRAIHGTKKEASDLVSVGLWHNCDGGYQINDWSDYQPSTEEHAKRSDKARHAAEERWRRKRDAG